MIRVERDLDFFLILHTHYSTLRVEWRCEDGALSSIACLISDLDLRGEKKVFAFGLVGCAS